MKNLIFSAFIDIKMEQGCDELDYLYLIYRKYKNFGNNFIVFIEEEKYNNLIDRCIYNSSTPFDLSGFLKLTKMNIELTQKDKEYIEVYG